MNTELLKKKILQLAMQGKLVEQDESDGTAEELINQILEEKKKLMAEGKIKKEKLSRIYKNPTDNHYYEKFEDGKKIDVTNQIYYEIPSEWEYVRLKNISSIISKGTTPRGGKNAYIEKGINYLRAENVKGNGYVSLDNIMYIDEKTHNSTLKRSILEEKDLLICIAGTLGRSAIITKDQLPANTNQAVCFIRFIKKEDVLVKFAQLIISSSLVQESLIKQTKAVAIPNLTLEIIGNCIIPIPPLSEQIRIVDKIEKLFDAVEIINTKYNTIKELQEKLKAKIIDLAIKGKLTQQLSTDEPSSKLIEKIVDKKHKLMKEGKIKKENLSVIYKDADNQFYEKFDDGKIVNITKELPFKIPTGWSWSRLRNIGIYKKGPFGSSLIKDMFVPKSNNTIKVYEQKNAINKDYTLGNYYITKQYFEQAMRGFEVEPGDIIVSCAGTIGETYILPSDIEKGIINQALMKMKIFNNINIDFFLMYFDQILKKESIKNGKGTAMKNIPPFAVFKEYLIPIPSQEEQERIIEKKISIFNYIKTAE